mgnify:CR=1 FL=1
MNEIKERKVPELNDEFVQKIGPFKTVEELKADYHEHSLTEKVDLLKAAGVDKEEITLARCKYQAQLDEYSRFCNKMGLKEQRERIYLDMRGRVAPSNAQYKKYLAEQAEKRVEKKNQGTKQGQSFKILRKIRRI